MRRYEGDPLAKTIKLVGTPDIVAGPLDANDKLNDYVTDGYMFADFPVRERALLSISEVQTTA